jgi:hypothetical protein
MLESIGGPKWKVISDEFNRRFGSKRNAKIVRERWFNFLNPELNKGEWSANEEIQLLDAVHVVGRRWAKVAKIMTGRTDHTVKNHFYVLLKTHVTDIKLDNSS